MKGKRGKMKIELIEHGRAVPKAQAQAVLLDMTHRFRARQEQARAQRQIPRLSAAPDRASVAKAMLAVEERLVSAFWTIARLPGERIGGNGRCGLDYVTEASDLKGYADAAGGRWESVAPRPPVPSAKEIDQAKDALEWLLLLEDERLRRILVVGATAKRGDVNRGVPWPRLRHSLGSYTERHLRNKYQEALRTIVTELTLARLGVG
jgi:hypothetical protein